MNKKILIILCMLMLLFPIVSAVRVDYSPNDKGVKDMKAVVKDTILFGLISVGEQGTMELKSHNTIYEKRGVEINTLTKEVNPAGIGLIYETNFGNEHKDALTDVKIIDMRTGKEVERDWRFVYSSEGQWEIPIYKEVCPITKTILKDEEYNEWKLNNCDWVFDYYEYSPRKIWNVYDNKNIPKGQFELGIEIEVKEGDYLDIVLKIQGKGIDKHAQVVEGIAGYIYAGGAVNQSVVKYDKDFNIVAVSPSYGGNIWSISLDDDYVYYGGTTTQTVRKAYKSNLTTITNSPNYGGNINSIISDDDYVYYGGGATQVIRKAYKSNLTTITDSPNYGGLIRSIAVDDDYVYYGGDTTQTVRKAYKTNLTTILDSPISGGNIRSISLDDDYVYYGGLTTQKVRKAYKSNLTTITDSPTYGGNIYTISIDDDYVYYGGLTTQKVRKAYKSNLTTILDSPTYGGNIWSISLDDDYVYYGGDTTRTVRKAYKSNLTTITDSPSYGGNIFSISLEASKVLEISLLSPENYYNSSSSTIDFSANLTDEGELGIANVSLVINDTIYDTNTSGLTGVYNFSETLSDGFYEWYVGAYDDTDEYYTSETRYFTIDILAPEIEILSPVTSYNYLIPNQIIDLNVSISDASDHLDSCWYKYPDENYQIYSNYFYSPFENITIDTYSYIIANVTPSGGLFPTTTTYELGYCNNLTFSDEGNKLYLRCDDEEPINLGFIGDWGRSVDIFGYNLTYFNCSENQTFNYIPDQNTLTVYANDTLGNERSESVSWDYKVLELSRNYNDFVYETGREEYEINLKSNDSLTGIKILYDSMEIILSKINDTLWSGSQNIFTSLIGTNDIIFEFNYSGETFQSYVSNQMVYELNYGFNPAYTNSLNITIRDEETNDIINDTTLYYNNIAWIGNGEVTKQFTESSLEDGEYMIGFSPSTISELNTNNHFWMDAPGYQLRNYYFEDITLYNDSMQNYTFYLLDSISGLVTRYKIVSPISGNAIENVKVTSYKESVPKILTEIAMTDATGVATLWQNADYFYEMTFEKKGCDTKVSKIRPSTSDIQIIEMNCEGDVPSDLSGYPWASPDDQKHFTLSISPDVQILYEGVNMFSGEVEDSDCKIESAVFNIVDANGTILNTTIMNDACLNNLSLSYNLTNMTEVYLELIVLQDGFLNRYSKIFKIIGSTQLTGIPDLWYILTMLPNYDELGFSISTRFFLAIVVLFVLLTYLSTIEGFKSEGIGPIIFILIYVLGLSILGWLNLPITEVPMLNKYGLFLLVSIMTGGIIAIKTNN